jgi:hypothetical protein
MGGICRSGFAGRAEGDERFWSPRLNLKIEITRIGVNGLHRSYDAVDSFRTFDRPASNHRARVRLAVSDLVKNAV